MSRMNVLVVFAAISVVVACGGSQTAAPTVAPTAPPKTEPDTGPPPADGPQHVQITTDTPRTTERGAGYVAPKGWRAIASGQITILDPNDDRVNVVIVDTDGADVEAALAAAWQLYRSSPPPAVATSADMPAQRSVGWDERRAIKYKPPAGEDRATGAFAHRAGTTWVVVIFDAPLEQFKVHSAVIQTLVSSMRPAAP